MVSLKTKERSLTYNLRIAEEALVDLSFPMAINAKWNIDSSDQDLNSGHRLPFSTR